MSSTSYKRIDATYNRPLGDRLVNAPIVRMNIQECIGQLKTEISWEQGDRNAITILHSDFQRVVLVALKEGAEMKRYKVDGAMNIHLLNGRVWIESELQSFSVDESDIAALEPGLSHSIFAEKESVLLLTFSGNSDGEF